MVKFLTYGFLGASAGQLYFQKLAHLMESKTALANLSFSPPMAVFGSTSMQMGSSLPGYPLTSTCSEEFIVQQGSGRKLSISRMFRILQVLNVIYKNQQHIETTLDDGLCNY